MNPPSARGLPILPRVDSIKKLYMAITESMVRCGSMKKASQSILANVQGGKWGIDGMQMWNSCNPKLQNMYSITNGKLGAGDASSRLGKLKSQKLFEKNKTWESTKIGRTASE